MVAVPTKFKILELILSIWIGICCFEILSILVNIIEIGICDSPQSRILHQAFEINRDEYLLKQSIDSLGLKVIFDNGGER